MRERAQEDVEVEHRRDSRRERRDEPRAADDAAEPEATAPCASEQSAEPSRSARPERLRDLTASDEPVQRRAKNAEQNELREVESHRRGIYHGLTGGSIRPYTLKMPKHKRISVDLPGWVEKATPCLQSVAEDVYVAKALAEGFGAKKDPRCSGLMSAAAKAMHKMEDSRAAEKLRCAEGDRAARKFWEAKVCARG